MKFYEGKKRYLSFPDGLRALWLMHDKRVNLALDELMENRKW
jgi:hypothetical protein